MKYLISAVFLIFLVHGLFEASPAMQQAAQVAAPKFTVDPSWPKIPNNWQFGQVASVSVDANDHVWILQRPSTLEPHEKAQAAPPVLEFDAAGNSCEGGAGPEPAMSGRRRSTASSSITEASSGLAAMAPVIIRS